MTSQGVSDEIHGSLHRRGIARNAAHTVTREELQKQSALRQFVHLVEQDLPGGYARIQASAGLPSGTGLSVCPSTIRANLQEQPTVRQYLHTTEQHVSGWIVHTLI